ncbi:Mobile element protein [Candidatus Enterovibrio altilux]|uniref:Mobile element protein n=1 Tax=Candidatus Enterovibrio altilux TaxID=1927128 RepID=A0A291B8F7_9GAMM|nr:Mobile element protein [Candidatus Enterovibrio luxaltus]
MVKCVFPMPLRSLQGFLSFVCKRAQLPLLCPCCSCIDKQTKKVHVTLKMKNKGTTEHLAIDFAGLKVYGEGE